MSKKKSSPPPPKTPSPGEQAKDISAARDVTDPREAQRTFEILSNPQFGLGPTTRLFEQTRQQEFPLETQVREQLLQNVFQNLASPTGLTPEQQQAIDIRRGEAQDEVTRGLRQRANLGGGLFGGRAQRTEERAVSDLQRAFAEEDINREERARLNAIQAALPALQILFPGVQLTPPAFQSAVQSPGQFAQGLVAQRGQDASIQQAEAQRQSNLMGSLFGALGTAGAGALGGPIGGAIGSKLGGRIT